MMNDLLAIGVCVLVGIVGLVLVDAGCFGGRKR